MDRETVKDIIYQTIEKVNKSDITEKKIIKEESYPLFGWKEKNVESITFITLVVAAESKIEEKFKVGIELDYEIVTTEEDPFKTVGTFIDWVMAKLQGISATFSKKLVVVDLDNTLWDGLVGENDWLAIYGKYAKLQKKLKELSQKGILLAILSKNEEQIAIDAIKSNLDMILSLDDFVTWRINWQDKAGNMKSILTELGLGEEATIFIDDSPQERDLIVRFFPKMEVSEGIDSNLFNLKAVTEEDKYRLQMYKTEKERQGMKDKFSSVEEWLESLHMEIEINELNEGNLPRVVQLMNKTNQMNLTTRRMSEKELLKWLDGDKRTLWIFSMEDKFGDSGIIGLITVDKSANLYAVKIQDFILSCRVIGRGIERVMLKTAIDYARTFDIKEVFAEYLPTERNKPCLDFWEGSGLEKLTGIRKIFCWPTKKDYLLPSYIKIKKENHGT